MTPAETVALIAALKAAYPRQELNRETLAIYTEQLSDLDAGIGIAAVRACIRTLKFFPTIAEIRTQAAELELALPTATEAYELAASGNGYGLIQRAKEAVGGSWAFKTTDRPERLRAQFINTYTELRDRAIRTETLGELTTTMPQLRPGNGHTELE